MLTTKQTSIQVPISSIDDVIETAKGIGIKPAPLNDIDLTFPPAGPSGWENGNASAILLAFLIEARKTIIDLKSELSQTHGQAAASRNAMRVAESNADKLQEQIDSLSPALDAAREQIHTARSALTLQVSFAEDGLLYSAQDSSYSYEGAIKATLMILKRAVEHHLNDRSELPF